MALTGDRLDPAERLFNALTNTLTDSIAAMPGGAPVDGRTMAAGVLRHMRRHLHRTQFVDEVLRIVGLVGTERDRLRPVGAGLDHVQCHSLGMSVGQRQAGIDQKAVAVLHQPMPDETQLGFLAPHTDVIRQELADEHGIVISLRSVERGVQHWRRELKAQKRATVRFETAPGHQMQIDFGDTRVWIGGERVRIHVFVGTLGYSRRMHIRASQRQRQADWFEGLEGAFLRFGGVPAEVLIDNAKALVEHHDAVTREVRFNARLHAFARYWGFKPRACAPYRARTKG
ncbi:hypothetical protein ABID19_006774 [Mesorhizobium robiniae]|uniref:Integrase catalytic domain-containing protein n=1 Tax=Mesorhizobium robiniae TaxID=559315 RepID=A0ABV2GZJ4_9HYPH